MKIIKKFTTSDKLNLLVTLILLGFMLSATLLVYYQIEHVFKRQKNEILAHKKAEIVEKTRLIHQIATRIYEEELTIEAIEREYKKKLVAVMDITVSLMNARYKKLTQQGVSDAKIQEELKHCLRNLRYDDGKGYFFTYDFEGKLVTHADPKLDGKNFYALQDTNGRYFVQEMLEVAKQKGEGFINYHWNKLGYDEPQLKLSYIKVFEPYQWMLGTGIYVEDVKISLKQKVTRLIATHRYNLGTTKSNYLFVLALDGLMISNPAFPKLSGLNVFRLTDISGKPFIKELIHVVSEEGEGFVEYYWPKPSGNSGVARKLTYGLLFEPLNWIISTGVYLDDIGIEEAEQHLRKEAQAQIHLILIVGTIFLILGSIASYLLMRVITRPLIQAKHVAESIAQGNFAESVQCQSEDDEIGQLIGSLNRMGKQLQESFSHLETQNHQLVKLNEEKNEFLGIVAHDLKNPLSGILGMASVIKEDIEYLSKAEVVEYAGLIATSTDQMFDLITNLLDVNVIESGKMRISLEKIDILPMINMVVKEHHERAKAKAIKINLQVVQCAQCIAFVDKNTVYQVFDNVISNSIKYSPSEKQVNITLSRTGKVVRCEVQDQGPGLSEKDQQKLFGKFTRLTPKPTGGEHSTGLGLFIVKKLVDAMHGKVWCETELNAGANFIIELPTE